MKILVAVKRVIDYNVQIRVKEDGTGIVTDNVKMSTNPPDDNAVEEFLMERSRKSTSVQIKDSRRKLRINSKISYDAPGIINNSPMIKRFETSRCSGEEWKGIYNRLTN